jgi:alpha-L-fucosidase
LYGKLETDVSLDRWLAKLKEVIDTYQPDQIWFDFGLAKVPDSYKQQFAAYYYNKEAEWGRPLIITRKGDHLPEGVGVLDIERGRMRDMGQRLWQTDDSTAYNSWCWVEGLRVKPARELIHELIDIVSKNGVLLLNVCPKADGSISDDQKQILREMGAWLKVNGEAIYKTRPWEYFGEGPTKMERGGGFLATIQYTTEDFRFTRSKDGESLYAIALGWPSESFTLRSVRVKNAPDGARATLLGHGEPLEFEVNSDRSLSLTPPQLAADDRPCQDAYVFKLTGFELEANPLYLPNATELTAETALLQGEQISLIVRGGQRSRIGSWTSPDASAHWLLQIQEPGDYRVLCEAAAGEASRLKLGGADGDLVFEVRTGQGRDNSVLIDAGTIRFEKSGVYHISLGAADRENWKPVSVWKLQLGAATSAK